MILQANQFLPPILFLCVCVSIQQLEFMAEYGSSTIEYFQVKKVMFIGFFDGNKIKNFDQAPLYKLCYDTANSEEVRAFSWNYLNIKKNKEVFHLSGTYFPV